MNYLLPLFGLRKLLLPHWWLMSRTSEFQLFDTADAETYPSFLLRVSTFEKNKSLLGRVNQVDALLLVKIPNRFAAYLANGSVTGAKVSFRVHVLRYV